jgi:trans-aconitate 2-methyltransferase
LLVAAGGRRWGLAVDLGCGPGWTTGLMAKTLKFERVVGYDTSENFIAQARSKIRWAAFDVHDVTSVPFPCGLADLIFCRFLL